ncbi:MAG: SusF/SusE family outer membrane protein [Muribaculaceae bacterium]|nr:SusF/SusE family outer membrane protein [Muribaculaceae bacterium]
MRFLQLFITMSIAASAAAVDMNHLYIVGPAATAGEWTADLPEEMVSIGYGTFIWEGYLGEGEFKFLNRLGDYDSSLVAENENQRVESGQKYTLVDNSSGQGRYDFKFWNPEAGECRIIANMSSNPMTVSFRRPVMLMVGTAVRGWSSPSQNIPVFADDEGVVEWTGLLQAGEIKFLAGNNWSPCYNAPSYNEAFTDGYHRLVYNVNGEDDHKFIVPRSGRYTLRFNLQEPSVTVSAQAGPSLAGAFTAAPGRYVVAADRNGRHLYFGAVPKRLFVCSLDGKVTPLQANGEQFSGQVYMESGNYYKLYSDEACADGNCFSPNADVDISSGATHNVAPMLGNSYTVGQTGNYNVLADFSGNVPSVSAMLNVSGVENMTEDPKVRVSVEGRDITVCGEYEHVSVADVYGRVISTSARTSVSPGIYIVVVDLKTFKLIVR